jgi:heparan-alpha-glucosaminide N-acetyltransferase
MKRILSIDVLRAITMLLMIFVNDVAGVSKIPDWIKHTAADYDGMGFSDIIFPAFLFIVGLSLPFAIQTKIKKGDSTTSLLGYVCLRSLALIVMGFFHVNFENYDRAGALINYPVYKIIVTLGFFLIWLAYPPKVSKAVKNALVTLGIVTIVLMAYVYKGVDGGLQPRWWGILGIIGWAYLFSALTYLLTRGKLNLLIIAFVIFGLINVTTHMDLLPVKLWLIGDASSITLMLGGVITATVYSLLIAKEERTKLWLFLTLAGLATIVFGFLIRPYAGGISKIYATPAWVFICMGITILTFELVVYVVDIKQKINWFTFIKPAGTSTLTCYLMPYLLYSIFTLIDFHYPAYLNYGIGGILRSLFISLAIIRIVAVLEKWDLRLKV